MRTKYFLSFFLFVQILILQVLPYFPLQVEQFYSKGFYPILSKFSRLALGSIPFSLGDLMYIILIGFILKWFWNQRKSWKLIWKRNILSILSFVSVFYFLFHSLWAFNYYRQPLFEKMEIKKDYSDADLLAFTKKLITKTNAIQNKLQKMIV